MLHYFNVILYYYVSATRTRAYKNIIPIKYNNVRDEKYNYKLSRAPAFEPHNTGEIGLTLLCVCNVSVRQRQRHRTYIPALYIFIY